MNDEDEVFRERLIGILTGKITNRLTLNEIKEGIVYQGGDITIVRNIEWLKNLNTFNIRKNGRFFWINVLLFLPLKEIPPLINTEDENVYKVVKYRLRIGK